MNILDDVLTLAQETPPVDNKQSRFGNPAFRTLYDKIGRVGRYPLIVLTQSSHTLHAQIANLPPSAIEEIEGYFVESWGNQQRIDYGSGMEFNFVCWMWVLVAGSN